IADEIALELEHDLKEEDNVNSIYKEYVADPFASYTTLEAGDTKQNAIIKKSMSHQIEQQQAERKHHDMSLSFANIFKSSLISISSRSITPKMENLNDSSSGLEAAFASATTAA